MKTTSSIRLFALAGAGAVAFCLAWPATLCAQTLYVSNGINTIQKVSPGGVVSQFAGTGLNNPYGLAFDTAGNLYAANLGNNTIERFTTGGSASQFASTGLSAPAGLAFDTAGNLYAANSNGTIERFTPGGSASQFASGLNGPEFLAFNNVTLPVVPEPTTWALLGLAVLGALTLRPRRQQA